MRLTNLSGFYKGGFLLIFRLMSDREKVDILCMFCSCRTSSVLKKRKNNQKTGLVFFIKVHFEIGTPEMF